MRKIYLDFDGTVVDVWNRYFKVLDDFLGRNGFSRIDIEAYKSRKKRRMLDHEIVKELTKQELNVEKYVEFKREALEAKEYLRLDSLIGKPPDYVGVFHQAGFLVEILSQRRNKENFLGQIESLKLASVFDAYIVVEPCAGKNAKYQYLCDKACKGDVMIGDSIQEKECAGKCGISFLFVDSGLYGTQAIGDAKIYRDITEIESICKDETKMQDLFM